MSILNWNLFLITEAKIQFFTDFEEILKLMKSPIATHLLELKDREVDIDFNFFGLTDKEDIVTFVQDSKIGSDTKVLYKVISYPWFMLDTFPIRTKFGISRRYQSYPEPDTIGYIQNKIPKPSDQIELRDLGLYNMPDSDICHFVSLDGKNYIITENYLEQQKEFTKDVRSTPIKVGRIAKKIFTDLGVSYTDPQYEEFVTEFKAKFELTRNKFRNFELVDGEEIRKWYLVDNYSTENRSTLQNSCMRYSKCQKFFDIYIYNKKVCQLLINKSDREPNKITGRALVWKLTNGETLMDQVYYSREQERKIFEEYAKSQGWIYSTKEDDFIKSDESIDGDDFEVQLEEWEVRYYPFMDTFKYLEISTGVLKINVTPREERDCYFLESQDGGNGQSCETCGGEGQRECDECDGSGDMRCGECRGKGEVDCQFCDGDGNMECPDCDGSGEDGEGECGTCDGEGQKECGDCSGRGNDDCPDCGGKGEIDCDTCDGDGKIDCPDC